VPAPLRIVVPSLVAAAALTLTGCSGDRDDGPSGSAGGATTSAAPADDATATPSPPEDTGSTGSGSGTADDGAVDAPPFPANTDPDTAEPSSGALLTVTDIRLGRHEGFDRVVFEVDGQGTPGWDVRYVDDPASQGSGDPVSVDGDAVLQVTLTGMGLPHDTGVEEWSGPDPLTSGSTEVVTELVFDATFEGTTVSFVGVAAEVPFRVYPLADPPRVVLEVTDPS